MILYTNGCSFTRGHGEVHNTEGQLNPPAKYVWANQIRNHFDDVIISALAGGSNDRILRTTMEYFSKPRQNHVAVIQWTSPLRYEVYVDLVKDWAGVCNLSQTNLTQSVKEQSKNSKYNVHFDNGKYISKFKKTTAYKNFISAAENQTLFVKSFNDMFIQYYKNVFLLENFLKQKNIPFMFTSMSYFGHLGSNPNGISFDDIDNRPTKYELNLKKSLDLSLWSQQPFTFYMGKNRVSATDGHPNKLGHKLIGDAILREMKQRGML